ncbi:hypothetical protein FEM48_Zijuj10G0158300 [Ziziphus jujuba var. spinosa]|uniref:6-phosphofructo-2-kinase domain-containing protein n=1 Tax=Ziziphus jujuba var. spinosa TaxID=714518 RepID=A0A978UPA5_ZIZJJ|nr:hypothetical protein FEM48_Zijuj10G0158300 [Ziziphus jujuba var. spinosa]
MNDVDKVKLVVQVGIFDATNSTKKRRNMLMKWLKENARDLSTNNLTGSIPVSLGQLASLQNLNLKSKILLAPYQLRFLGLFPWLDVSNNKLDGSVHNATSGLVVTSIVQDPKA